MKNFFQSPIQKLQNFNLNLKNIKSPSPQPLKNPSPPPLNIQPTHLIPFQSRLVFASQEYFLQVLIQGMDNDEYANPKMQYSKITFNKRLRLIQMVQLKHYSIYKASKQLGISNSTAKLIVKNYREEGRIFQKKDQKKSTQKKPSSELFSNEKNETMIKQEASEAPQAKIEPSTFEFNKLLSQITQLNREWLSIQLQRLT